MKAIICLSLGLLAVMPAPIRAMQPGSQPSASFWSRAGKPALWAGGLVCAGLLICRALAHMKHVEQTLREIAHPSELRVYFRANEQENEHTPKYLVAVWDSELACGKLANATIQENGQVQIIAVGIDFSDREFQYMLVGEGAPLVRLAAPALYERYNDGHLFADRVVVNRVVAHAHQARLGGNFLL